jgi:choline dehydrogenase-like flavoprotein
MRLGDWLRRNRLGGWHYGGSLPMTNSPAENYQCHPNGENKGLPGVFIIDASGFPSIPGSSVALLTMANSYRIAKSYIGNI